ncbi:MAG: YqhA family protein [Cyanobacteria bacterium K_DeepCast_35m_m2_155]|nr:YqhA family protein [Cyanobacteria bacterium K_DeepCast_35m_m2_155]
MVSRIKRLELKLERALWRIRLVAVLPVLMSLMSSVATFILGTKQILKALFMLNSDSTLKSYIAELIGSIIGGIDLYLIGIALLIFGYGVYELLISPIDPARDGDQLGSSLLDIRDLDQLKEKLVKVLVVALIVYAFQTMITLSINTPQSLAFFSLSVLLLALSGWLVAVGHSQTHAADGRHH